MKQVVQRLRDGNIEVMDVPTPECSPEGVLVDVRASLLSSGTERSKVQTAQQSLLGKARARPDQVRQVVEKTRQDGVRQTLEAVRMRLDQPGGLGYSAAGVVLQVGERVPDLTPGQTVACGGGGYANHADVDHVPGNLCVPLPDGVGFVEGAFATVGSIALHGVRQADVTLGERVAVIGLGLVGQLTGQLLRAAGCTVVAIDLQATLVDRALSLGAADAGFRPEQLGAELPEAARDCDAVIITAATTSDDPVRTAAELCRDRGRVVIVGDVGMDIPRPGFYGKELELRLSRSYGPGRYDRNYEERGLDYPIGYVRWTERRNMQAFLELVARRRVNVADMVTDRFPVEEAPAAYKRLLEGGTAAPAIVLEYGPSEQERTRNRKAPAPQTIGSETANLSTGVIGTGSFAQRILIPAVKAAGFPLEAMASASGVSARAAADRFQVPRVENADTILDDPGIGLVVIATRHASHAPLATRALRAGKHTFVEKPPCLTVDELLELSAARAEGDRGLGVGFNRRHAPLATALRKHIREPGAPFELIYRVNAGTLPDGHWLNDLDDGGGRLVGEGCHFIDFACWLADAPAERVTCLMRPAHGEALGSSQEFTVVLQFGDRSTATISYGTAGAPGLGKERVEVHAANRSAVLDDFRSLTLTRDKKSERVRSRGQDKGHAAQFVHLHKALVAGSDTPQELDPLESMATTLAASRSAREGRVVSVASVLDGSRGPE